jgi:hypothetical protein
VLAVHPAELVGNAIVPQMEYEGSVLTAEKYIVTRMEILVMDLALVLDKSDSGGNRKR